MSRGSRSLVLAVDDNIDSLKLIERFLSSDTCQVVTVDSATKALGLVDRLRPDLLLLDVMMPEMDGYQLCARLQEGIRGEEPVPVVFVTGLGEEQDRARAFAVGGVDYLTKPFKKDTLRSVVEAHLRAKSRWYNVTLTQELWDETPLPDKYLQFRSSLIHRLRLTSSAAGAMSSVKAPEVYSLTEILNLSEADLAEMMAEFLGLPYVREVDPKSIQLGILPVSFCRSQHVVAVRTPEGENAFVISNPFVWDLDQLDTLHRAFRGQPYRLMLTSRRAMSALFFDQATEAAVGAATAPAPSDRTVEVLPEAKTLTVEDLAADEHGASAVEIVDALIADAVRRGASDLHIEPERNRIRVRYRIDGRMHAVMPFPRGHLNSLVARIKIMSGMDIAESRKPQDGGCMVRVQGREVELRASTLPGTQGEIVVLRVLGQNKALLNLDSIGFEPDMLRDWRRLLAMKQGMVLITGPTGSGKTTTLYASLNHLNREDVNVLTVEDPVEVELEGINQVTINERAGRSFAATLRAMLRQDPDIIMVGEIRDVETAEIACRAALTGHLVLSTLHTQNTFGTLVRLFDMGVPPYLAASALNAVQAQRLVSRVCPDCAVAYDPPASLKRVLEVQFGSLAGAQFRRGEGCARCHRLGTRGRVGVFELLIVDDDLRHMLSEGAAPSRIREHVARRGFRTLEEDAFRKACQGIIAPEEIVNLGLGVALALEDAPASAPGES